MRHRLAWGLALPLALAGTQAAHALAYTLVYPQASFRVAALDAAGHSYLTWLPVVLACGAACALLSFGGAVASAARGRPERVARPWVFALLAPSVFVLQEVIELSLHTATFGWRAVLAPTFLPGLALQLPFALLAYVAARILMRAAAVLGCALARAQQVWRTASFTPHVAPLPRGAPVHGLAARGPPCVVGI
jgi:hypothetical protein